LGALHMKVV